MMKDVKLLSGKDLMKVDVVMLNEFVNKCAPIWNPVFKSEFEKENFNFQEYAMEMENCMKEVRYNLTCRKLDKYNIDQEMKDFIEKETLKIEDSENILKSCMNLMCIQQIMMESILNKDNVNDEMYMFNLIKGFIHSMKEFEIKSNLDLSFIPLSETLKLTLETLVMDEDKEYIKF